MSLEQGADFDDDTYILGQNYYTAKACSKIVEKYIKEREDRGEEPLYDSKLKKIRIYPGVSYSDERLRERAETAIENAVTALKEKLSLEELHEIIPELNAKGGRRRNLTKRRKQKRQQRNRRRTSNRYN